MRKFTLQHSQLRIKAEKDLLRNMLKSIQCRMSQAMYTSPKTMSADTLQATRSVAAETYSAIKHSANFAHETYQSFSKPLYDAANNEANSPKYRAGCRTAAASAAIIPAVGIISAATTASAVGLTVGATTAVSGGLATLALAAKTGAENTPAAMRYAAEGMTAAGQAANTWVNYGAGSVIEQSTTMATQAAQWTHKKTGGSVIATGAVGAGAAVLAAAPVTAATTVLVANQIAKSTAKATVATATVAAAVAKATTIPGMLLGGKKYIAPGEFGPVVKRRPFFTTPETYQDVFGKGLAAINDEKQLSLNEEYRTKASKLLNDNESGKNSAELKRLQAEYNIKREELDQAARTSMPTSLMDLLNYNARLKIEDAKRNGTKLELDQALDQAINEAQTSANLKPGNPSLGLLDAFNLEKSTTFPGTVTTQPSGNFSYTNEALDNKKKVMRKLLKEALDADKQLVAGENGNMAIQDNDNSSAGIKTWNKPIKLTKDDIKLFGTMSQDLDNQLEAGKQILAGLQAQQTALLAMENPTPEQNNSLDELDKKAGELKEALDELSEKRQLLSANKEGGIQKTDLSAGELIEAVGDLAVDIETGNDGRFSITPNLNKLKPKLSADEKSKLSSYMNHVDKSNLQGFLNTIFEREINKALKSIGKAQTTKHANSHIATLKKYNKALKTAMQDTQSLQLKIDGEDPKEAQERANAWEAATHAANTSSKKTTAAIKEHEKTLEKKVENTQRLTADDFGGNQVLSPAEPAVQLANEEKELLEAFNY